MGPALRVRPARATDLAAIAAIERSSFSDPWSAPLFADPLRSRRARFLVAVDERGDIAGYVIGIFVADEGEIANLAVAPTHRRQGLGARLLEAVIDAARTAGVATLHLEVRESNGPARALYRRFGFGEAGRRPAYYRNPVEDALVLRLAVAARAAGAGPAAT